MSSSNSQLSSSEQLDRVPNGGQSGSGAVANGKGPITKPFWELDGYKVSIVWWYSYAMNCYERHGAQFLLSVHAGV